MKLHVTDVFYRQVESLADHKVVVSYGGSSSSKTISALQQLTLRAQKFPKHEVLIIGQSVPILKRNLIKDWRRIIMGDDFNRRNWNETDRIYTFANGSVVKFINADDPDKFRGLRCDDFMIDECNNVHYSVFKQLFARARGKAILTFNPDREFWISQVMKMPNAAVIHSTFEHNHMCPAPTVENLRMMAELDENFAKVYMRGEWGTLDGLVLPKFKIVDKMPSTVQWETIGVDFGWNDPLAVVHCAMYDGELYFDELLYGQHIPDTDLLKMLAEHASGKVVYCDEACPKDIAHLIAKGIYAIGAKKKGGIMYGIKLLRNCNINITKRSANILREITNYSFMKVKGTDELLDQPIDKFNHSIDAIRYGCIANLEYDSYENY